MTGSAKSPPAISWNSVRSFAPFLKGTGSLPESDSDVEGASPPGLRNRSGPLFFFVALPLVVVILAMVALLASIVAIMSASLLLSVVGVTILGLTKTSGDLYTNVTIVSLFTVTACGAAVITAAGAALVLAFLPVSMCCGGKVVSLAFSVALSGAIGAAFFAPAIGIAITRGHIIDLSVEFTAKAAMKMNGVGLGGVLACGLALLIPFCVILGCLATSRDAIDVDT